MVVTAITTPLHPLPSPPAVASVNTRFHRHRLPRRSAGSAVTQQVARQQLTNGAGWKLGGKSASFTNTVPPPRGVFTISRHLDAHSAVQCCTSVEYTDECHHSPNWHGNTVYVSRSYSAHACAFWSHASSFPPESTPRHPQELRSSHEQLPLQHACTPAVWAAWQLIHRSRHAFSIPLPSPHAGLGGRVAGCTVHCD